MAEEAPLLEVDGLEVSLLGPQAPIPLVRSLSFSLAPGASLGLVGESGSGKTLSCLALVDLLPSGIACTGGDLRWREGGETLSLRKWPARERERIRGGRIGMIFQDPAAALNPVLRCGQQVEEVVRRHCPEVESPREEALDWLRRVQLDDPEAVYRAYPWSLSGGQQQRVMIATALAGRPRLVIADEPTSALDRDTQTEILALLRELRSAQGCAFLYVSHDLALIEEMTERTLVMREGTIVEEGQVEKVMRQPAHPYTRGLLACRPGWANRLRRLPVMADFLERGPDGAWRSTGRGVEEVLAGLRLSPQAIGERREKLYGSPPAIQVRDLSVSYPRRERRHRPSPAVRQASFQVYPGEILGLVGPSGSGKSTLARALLGLLPGAGGSILWKGENLLERSPEGWRSLRRHWQLVFQDARGSLNPRYTVGQAIAEAIRPDGAADPKQLASRVAAHLREVRLGPEFAERYPEALSGGQRQRVALARALAIGPEFLICDEPVSALDVSVQAEILNLLRAINRKKQLTCLFIAHDLEVVRAISDRVLVMRSGEIVEEA